MCGRTAKLVQTDRGVSRDREAYEGQADGAAGRMHARNRRLR
jgi:hypothetical protein